MNTFAVTLVRGPAWDAGRDIRAQRGWDQHADFMDGLVATGVIVVGGPVGDQRQTLHLVQARDEAEVRALLSADPWAGAGLLEVGTVQPWALWLDFRRLGATPDAPG